MFMCFTVAAAGIPSGVRHNDEGLLHAKA
jgi:hypothetical protein